MTEGDLDCPFRDDHPEYMARVDNMGDTLMRLEVEVTKLRDARIDDFKDLQKQMGEVHEKVNKIANGAEKLSGKLAVYSVVTMGGGAIVMFVLNRLFEHASK